MKSSAFGQQQLSVDSFVDIVANSVGILIIVVLVAVLASGQKSTQLSADRKSLLETINNREKIEHELSTCVAERNRLKAQIELVETTNATSLGSLRDARKAHQTGLKTLDELKSKTQDLAITTRELKNMLTDRQARIATLRGETERVLEGVSAELVAVARASTREQLDTRLEDTVRRAQSLETGNEELAAQREALDEQLKSVTETLAATDEALAKETAELVTSVAIRTPPGKLPPKASPVWFECYMPGASLDADGVARAAVRAVSSANFTVKDGALTPVAEGESFVAIAAAGSRYQQRLRASDESYKKQHPVYFVVRPEAQRVLRVARDLALEAGWTVCWDPIPAGNTLSLFPSAPPPSPPPDSGAVASVDLD